MYLRAITVSLASAHCFSKRYARNTRGEKALPVAANLKQKASCALCLFRRGGQPRGPARSPRARGPRTSAGPRCKSMRRPLTPPARTYRVYARQHRRSLLGGVAGGYSPGGSSSGRGAGQPGRQDTRAVAPPPLHVRRVVFRPERLDSQSSSDAGAGVEPATDGLSDRCSIH